MFSPDIVSLRQFYATPLGALAQSLVVSALHELWPAAPGDTLLGIGYCAPYLPAYMAQLSPVLVCMPAQQGAAYWPPAQPNLVFLAHESELPLPENSMNRVLLLHSIEHSEQLSWMIEEIWRVLTPGGRVLAVVPNRRGLWSRSSKSPFGYGRPFSLSQMRDLLGSHHFTLMRHASALFVPPVRFKPLWRLARHIEFLGKHLWPFFGGVLLVEAEKQLYAGVHQPVAQRRGYRVPIPSIKPAMGMK